MNQATFPALPPLRTDVRNPLDEVFSTRIVGSFPIRQINVGWWKGFDIPLPLGSHILIREDTSQGFNVSYQLIATEDSFRRVIYVCQLDESGPEYDMTREQYFEHFYSARAASPVSIITEIEPVEQVLPVTI
jgi:hypothetical protein